MATITRAQVLEELSSMETTLRTIARRCDNALHDSVLQAGAALALLKVAAELGLEEIARFRRALEEGSDEIAKKDG